ncbi:hypothetical protein [Pajaroellobacter abortibovis]|uniref:Uncharacterized protein n=1 Tax=Pajaroellobacter abortibovis TaxID=1882918 RepID=A0A1L6MXA8_9BACT|nr:hypothetical protein [Pajaroellobacter abortibovis]APS00160.1 hypothetical protein BCY86_05295 [Pajaroellobacter abortibovis]
MQKARGDPSLKQAEGDSTCGGDGFDAHPVRIVLETVHFFSACFKNAWCTFICSSSLEQIRSISQPASVAKIAVSLIDH